TEEKSCWLTTSCSSIERESDITIRTCPGLQEQANEVPGLEWETQVRTVLDGAQNHGGYEQYYIGISDRTERPSLAAVTVPEPDGVYNHLNQVRDDIAPRALLDERGSLSHTLARYDLDEFERRDAQRQLDEVDRRIGEHLASALDRFDPEIATPP